MTTVHNSLAIRNGLFRTAALDAAARPTGGAIVLARPLPVEVFVVFAVLIAAALTLLAIFGTYTRRSTLTGQLVPDGGLVKVYVPQYGIIAESKVDEGSQVLEGQELYLVSRDTVNSDGSPAQSEISNQIRIRARTLAQQIDRLKEIEESERRSLTEKAESYKLEIRKLAEQITTQSARLAIVGEAKRKYESLGEKGVVSKEQVSDKYQDLLDQRTKLEDLERTEITTKRSLSETQSDLRENAGKYESQLADVEEQLTTARSDLIDSESKRLLKVVAPTSGIATGVVAKAGQAVDMTRPLLSIIPSGAQYSAELYAPSEALGFVKEGDAVVLMLDAYPYEQYGHWKGKVLKISHTTLSTSELTSNGQLSDNSTGSSAGKALYRVTVALPSQTFVAAGEAHALQAGMTLKGDILEETRQLYRWALDPMNSLGSSRPHD